MFQSAIVRRQKDFLDHGVQHIKPMMLKDIAEDIGMHLSTVSRVVNRKYAHTPQGVFELRRFFTEGMMNEEGEEISTRIIKLKIKKLIEEEDSHNPITDDHVVKILAKDGIKLSRRTVAKYRDQMSIPGSRAEDTDRGGGSPARWPSPRAGGSSSSRTRRRRRA